MLENVLLKKKDKGRRGLMGEQFPFVFCATFMLWITGLCWGLLLNLLPNGVVVYVRVSKKLKESHYFSLSFTY